MCVGFQHQPVAVISAAGGATLTQLVQRCGGSLKGLLDTVEDNIIPAVKARLIDWLGGVVPPPSSSSLCSTTARSMSAGESSNNNNNDNNNNDNNNTVMANLKKNNCPYDVLVLVPKVVRVKAAVAVDLTHHHHHRHDKDDNPNNNNNNHHHHHHGRGAMSFPADTTVSVGDLVLECCVLAVVGFVGLLYATDGGLALVRFSIQALN